MRKMIAAAALAAVGIGATVVAVPAMAGNSNGQYLTGDPCTSGYISNAVACQGYYGGNLITGAVGDATSSQVQSILYTLLNGTPPNPTGTTPTSIGPGYVAGSYGTPDYTKIIGLVSGVNGATTFNFAGLNLSGLTLLGAHFGNNTDSSQNNVTAFWLVNLGPNTTSSISLSGSIGMGTSNAEIYATGLQGAVPEPATWAMMLLGFGGIGLAMKRKQQPKLAQIA